MKYWITLYRPNNYDPSTEDEAMGLAIDALNDEMVAAGVRVFAGGLQDPTQARSLLQVEGGEFEITEGPYLKTAEFVGGFWVLELQSLDDALAWGRKASLACRTPVEVRPFY